MLDGLVGVEARLLRARIALALRQPFLAGALMRLPFRAIGEMAWCRTMATDGYRIFYNPAWTSRLAPAELRGVIAHELMHVLFSHSSRIGGREPGRWNEACDHAINLLLLQQGFRLPEGGMMDRRFAGLPAEEIYARLTSAGGRGSLLVAVSRAVDEDSDGILAEVGTDILDPADPRLAPTRLTGDPDQEQQRDLVVELRGEALAKLHGTASAWFTGECQGAELGRLDWRALLRSWMHDRIRNDWSLWPPSKRFIHRGLLMPSVGVESPGHLVIAVDTSGSMSDSDLAAVFSEVRLFRETFPCRLTIVQADARVQSVEEYGEMDGFDIPSRVFLKGRGGTDFRPVFDWFERNAEQSSCALIFATDGFGSFPKIAPPWPVVWLRTRAALAPEKFPFGVTVSLS